MREGHNDAEETLLRNEASLILNVLVHNGKKETICPSYKAWWRRGSESLFTVHNICSSRFLCFASRPAWAQVWSLHVKRLSYFSKQCPDRSTAGRASAACSPLSSYTAAHNRKWEGLWLSLHSWSAWFSVLSFQSCLTGTATQSNPVSHTAFMCLQTWFGRWI